MRDTHSLPAVSARFKGLKRRAKRFRPRLLEWLEDRTMLAGDVVQDIVVGRRLSQYFAGDVPANRQVQMVLTVYNQQSDDQVGVRLTDTLAPGVSLIDASIAPDRDGQTLSWSMGTLPGYERREVTLTLQLPETLPSQLDSGASVAAMENALVVVDAAPPATLRAGSVSAPALLASTPDANTTDPFIQEAAARLDYNPQAIFDFLHTEIGYNAYTGSLRGARGTLWSRAGNGLDVASLGVALMRASGIPAQYVAGTLPSNIAQQLIVSMFPSQAETIGHIQQSVTTSSPQFDFTLQDQTRNHHWFQYDNGGTMVDADPLVPGAGIGQTFTTSTGTFAEVPDALREKTRIRLDAEMFSQAAALFGIGDGLSTTTVLDQTFNDVDLYGRPITIGAFVSSSGTGFILTATTHTYTPYLELSDLAYPDSSANEVLRGTPFQEVITNFPLGTQALTGLFLNMTLSGPNGADEDYSRALVDRIGFAARTTGSAAGLSLGSNPPPALTNNDAFTLFATPGFIDRKVYLPFSRQLASEAQRAAQIAASLPAGQAPTAEQTALMQRVIHDTTIAATLAFLTQSDFWTRYLAKTSLVAAYYDRPRLTIVSNRITLPPDSTGNATAAMSIDLRRDTLRVIAAPGQATRAAFDYNVMRGIMENQLESAIFPPPVSGAPNVQANVSTLTIFDAAAAQGIAITVLGAGDTAELAQLAISDQARARINEALAAGKLVAVPTRSVDLNGKPTVGWYEIDNDTGETIAVTEDGGHQNISEYAAAFVFAAAILVFIFIEFFAEVLGWVDGFFLYIDYQYTLINIETSSIEKDPTYDGPFNVRMKPGYQQAEAQALTDLRNKKVRAIKTFYKWAEAFDFKRSLTLKRNFEKGIHGALSSIAGADPPVGDLLVVPEPDPTTTIVPINPYAVEVPRTSALSAGAVNASGTSSNVSLTGDLTLSWNATSATGLPVSAFSASSAKVVDSQGRTVASGPLALTNLGATAVVSGNVAYEVRGTGNVTFYGGDAANVAAAASWENYTAKLTGSATITLTTDQLVLNGNPLPRDTYRITTSSATLSGSGAGAAPDLAGTVGIDATGAVVRVGPGAGNAKVGGGTLDPSDGWNLTGYTGHVDVKAKDTSNVALTVGGSAANVIALDIGSGTLTTDQNNTVTIPANIASSFADTYHLEARAPKGWSVSTDGQGKLLIQPAPGVQSGTYAVVINAVSTANNDLLASRAVQITVNPTQAAVSLDVVGDALFTVDVGGAQLTSGYRAIIKNLGPQADTFNITFPNAPGGFTVLASKNSVTIPAGGTGIVGVYLRPNGAVPPIGTQVPFTVQATSTSQQAINASDNSTYVVPEVNALSIVFSPTTVIAIPGASVPVALTLSNPGNVALSNVTFTTAITPGLAIAGLADTSLAIGETKTLNLTLTPNAATPLNSNLGLEITAHYGTGGSIESLPVGIPVRVAAPGADAIAKASVAAQQLGNTGLLGRLNDLSIALTNLVQQPTNAVYRSQAGANIDSLISQLANDPFLSTFAAPLTAAKTQIAAATTAAELQAAVTTLGQALGTMSEAITDVAQHGFTASLTPDRLIIQPGAPLVFSIPIQNTGSSTTSYNFSVSGLPANVTAQFSQASITLQPGQSLVAGSTAPTLTLIMGGDTLAATGFVVTITASGAPVITRSLNGQLTLRDEVIVVSGVVAAPATAPPGAPVAVSAKIQGVVNQPTHITASFVVLDAANNVLFTSPAIPVDLGVTSGLVTAPLGSFDTSGVPNGVYTIKVLLSNGRSATTPLLIGQPVTASLTTTPSVIPATTDTVTSTVTVTTLGVFPDPLTLLSSATTAAQGTSVAIYQANGHIYAYESGTGGVDIFDVTNPSNPQHLLNFGQSDLVGGNFGFNVTRVVGDKLLVGTTTTLNASGFNVLVYSLADPTNPAFVSNTFFARRFFGDFLVNDDASAAFVPTGGVSFFGNSIFTRFGNFTSVDLSDPTHPTLGSSLFNSRGDLDGGDMTQSGGAVVNDHIVYSAGLAPGDGTVIGNHGNLLVVDYSNVHAISLINQLAIPDTIGLNDVAVSGNRALVVGTAGNESNIIDFNTHELVNHLTLTVLDITDATHPIILGQTLVTNHQFPQNEPGSKVDALALGNGAFAVSGTAVNGLPALAVVDASDPNNIVVGALQTPSFVAGITVAGDKLYASTATGLSVYQIQPLVSSAVTITVNLPAGAADKIVAGSFNITPTEINKSVSGDTLVWRRAFAAGNTSYAFSWQNTVSDVQAGTSKAVTTGAVVAYLDQGNPASVTLPGTSVSSVPFLAVTPASRTQQPGGKSVYNVRLTNPTDGDVTFSLSSQQTPFIGQVELPFNVTVPAHGAVDVPMTITSGTFAQPGDATITVNAHYTRFASDFVTKLSDYQDSASATLTIGGAPVTVPDETAHGVVVQLTPPEATVGQGTEARFVARLTNTGSEDEFFSLEAVGLPAGVTAQFENFFVNVPAGATNYRDVTLVVHNFSAAAGSYPFTVTAAASNDSAVNSQAAGTLHVVGQGVSVSLSPDTRKPGGGFTLTVRNTGTQSDTFDLSLGGPAALVANLATTRVALAAGASQEVAITTSGVNFAVPGALDLSALATSTTATTVRAMDSGTLQIDAVKAMDASLERGTVTLSSPGTGNFSITVNNKGNVEDVYRAVITGTTGPVTAYLVGPDGQPTQSIDRFRLLSLGSGQLMLRIVAAAGGTGTATVQIRSLSDDSIVSTVTATLVAGAGQSVAPRVLGVERLGIHEHPTTLVVQFDRPLNRASAENEHNYILTGPQGRIRILEAIYDAATNTVTLRPAQRLPLNTKFRLTIRGTGKAAVVGATGLKLDGDANGKAGGDYKIKVTRKLLVQPGHSLAGLPNSTQAAKLVRQSLSKRNKAKATQAGRD